MKRRFSIILALTLLSLWALPAYGAPLTSAEKEQLYSASVLELETYLEGAGASETALTGIYDNFSRLGGYEQSRPLMYYTRILIKLQNNEYDFDMELLIDTIEHNDIFAEYLTNTLKSSAIQPLEKLKNYVYARYREFNRKNDEALEYYRQCMGFFDADVRYYALVSSTYQQQYDRALELLRAGDYAGGYFALGRILGYNDSEARHDAIANVLGYAPANETDNPQPVRDVMIQSSMDNLGLKWDRPKHATGYKVAIRPKGQTGWQYYDWNEEALFWRQLVPDTAYELSIVTVVGQVELEPVILTASTAAEPTPAPATPAPATPAPTPAPTAERTSVPLFRPAATAVPEKPRVLSVHWDEEKDGVAVTFDKCGIEGTYFIFAHLKLENGHYGNGGGNDIEAPGTSVVESFYRWTIDFIPGRTYGISIDVEKPDGQYVVSDLMDVTVPITDEKSPVDVTLFKFPTLSAKGLKTMYEQINAAWDKSYDDFARIADAAFEKYVPATVQLSGTARVLVTAPDGSTTVFIAGERATHSFSYELGFSFSLRGLSFEEGIYTLDFYDWDRKCHIGTWHFMIEP